MPCRGRVKIFSVDEAEETLPLVGRITQDLTAEYPRWRTAVADYEMLSGGAKADKGETDELLSACTVASSCLHRARSNGGAGRMDSPNCCIYDPRSRAA